MKLIKENCPTCTKARAVITLKTAGLQNTQPAVASLGRGDHAGSARAWIDLTSVVLVWAVILLMPPGATQNFLKQWPQGGTFRVTDCPEQSHLWTSGLVWASPTPGKCHCIILSHCLSWKDILDVSSIIQWSYYYFKLYTMQKIWLTVPQCPHPSDGKFWLTSSQ